MEPTLVQACTPLQHTASILGGAERIAAIYDDLAADLSEGRKNARAWEALKLDQAHIANRRAQNAATIDHALDSLALLAGQVGVTAGQAPVSPIRTATGDNLAAGAAPADRVVDSGAAVSSAGIAAAVAEAVQGNVTVQLAELSTAVTALAGGVTTALQALADSNALIASALSSLKPAAPAAS